MEWSFNLGSFIAGLLGGGTVGAFVSFKLSKQQSVKGSGTNVDQSNATAGGDIVGRDKKINQ